MLPPYLTDTDLDALIARALEEDLGSGDVTTQAIVAPETQATGVFLAKEAGTLAGLEVARRVFAAVDPYVTVNWTRADGQRVEAGTVFGTVTGAAASLLMAERLALNLLQRMSGIATATRRMVDRVRPYGTRILDTRKTAPGLRLLDKWAVRLGDGTNHRIGLFDMILIKENHIAAAGGIEAALAAAQTYRITHAEPLEIEIEVRTLEELQRVLAYHEAHGGVEVVLLDNMTPRADDGSVDTTLLRRAVRLVDGQIGTEASGNVTLATVEAIAATGVDAISCGALTHSAAALDLSLTIDLR
ncbi:MAG: carboxylating nicotinate-nucleotide diphosphorylase [Bacteroidetes bacterium]|nr:MAG: carboxylating nicotinate-nucleotide diphosphorylase [Bacteroidota bacterium]